MSLTCTHVYARELRALSSGVETARAGLRSEDMIGTSFPIGSTLSRQRGRAFAAPTAPARAPLAPASANLPLATLHRGACPRSGAFTSLNHHKAMSSEVQLRQQAFRCAFHRFHQSNPPVVFESNLNTGEFESVQEVFAVEQINV